MLARELFAYCDSAGNRARTLLLSATPYRMLTLDHEGGEDDHCRDFGHECADALAHDGSHLLVSQRPRAPLDLAGAHRQQRLRAVERLPFLSALARRRPGLQVRLLLWDFSVLYASERESFPLFALQWKTPPGVAFSLDSEVPSGSSQHQKLIVIDGCLAFSGGLDLTIRRWDTPGHELENRWRIDPGGNPYRPFHDVQAMLDGDAARALSEIVQDRWRRATGSDGPTAAHPSHDSWPETITPDFFDVAVGISRTRPRMQDFAARLPHSQQIIQGARLGSGPHPPNATASSWSEVRAGTKRPTFRRP
jgi:hypothetical protein